LTPDAAAELERLGSTHVLSRLSIDDGFVDLGGFESHIFEVGDRIIRLTHDSHRSEDQILGELEWLTDLKSRGAAVCAPLPLADGLTTRVDNFTACCFERARGRTIEEADWGRSLFAAWGAGLGALHQAGRDFAPTREHYRRSYWLTDDNLDLAARIPADQTRVIELARARRRWLLTLDESPRHFGLIHSDAHLGNFLVDVSDEAFGRGDHLTFFDFDDACYCWYAYVSQRFCSARCSSRGARSTMDSGAVMRRGFWFRFWTGGTPDGRSSGADVTACGVSGGA